MINLNPLDFVILILSIIGIGFEIFQISFFWILYILASMLLGWEFFTQFLYGSLFLQIIYIVMGIWGMYKWRKKGKNDLNVIKISYLTKIEILYYALITIIAEIGVYFILIKIDGSSGIKDSILTTLSIIATYLSCYKKIESWFIFVLTVFISVPLYLSHQLYFTAVTYIIFAVLDLTGGIKWIVQYKKSISLNMV